MACSGCGAAHSDRPQPTLAPAARSQSDATGERPLAALTTREKALVPELKNDVDQLATKIGERNADKKWELASASDYVAGELEKAGYMLDRQGFEVGEIVAQNLGVELRGGHRGDEIVLVGAHYDSARGTPGADGASGTAALLALARGFKKARPMRTLRFVAFVNGEAPFQKTKDMGSLIYAKRAAVRGEHIVAMISIESIGYFSDAAGTQHAPPELAQQYPAKGNFVAVLGNAASQPLIDRVVSGFAHHGSISAHGAASDADGDSSSDHWAFWQVGYPAVLLTDTATFRNPNHHKLGDTANTLDFERMARVVAGLEGVIMEIAGEDRALVLEP